MLTLLRIGWTNLTPRSGGAGADVPAADHLLLDLRARCSAARARRSTARIRVAVVDEDRSELSRRLVEGLKKESGLRVRTAAADDAAGAALDRPAAERW